MKALRKHSKHGSAVHHQTQDVLSIIKDQHDILRKSIRILKNDGADPNDKQDHLAKFISLLTMHSEAEEQTIYDVLKDIQMSEMTTLEAIEEHTIAKNLVQDLEDADYKSYWNNNIAAKAKVLAEIVELHANEEEKTFFKEARKLLTKEELIFIGEEFEKKCRELKEGLDIPLHSLDSNGYSYLDQLID